MKHIINKTIGLLLSVFIIAACSPQVSDEFGLGELDTVTPDQVTFTAAPTSKSANEIVFTNTTDIKAPYSVVWDLGNGVKGKGKTIVGQYPEKGEYTVTLTLYTADGTAASKSQVLTFTDDDFSLIDTPVYRMLTGGAENTKGKTWVFDQYNNFIKEVADALKLDMRGHMGLGPLRDDNGIVNYGQIWWGAGPNEKSMWKMYDFKFTFFQTGVKLKIENAGEGYGRAATAGSFPNATIVGEDAVFPYNGGDYTFGINEDGTYPQLELSGNAFMGYHAGNQIYEILYQTDEVMALAVENPIENQRWVFIYCLEELNVAEKPVEKTLKAKPLEEEFDVSPLKITFQGEDMGSMSGVVDNPLPLPINETAKVYRYQKTNAFYTNLFWVAPDYKFDLTTQHKIRLKVMIPSYNDYDKENDVAGEWIAEKRLRPQIAVKLQNAELGGNAWTTQTEIIKGDLEMDKWLELEFDFSSVKDRTDYDKIVIQFGSEGQSGAGFFFFDDFRFVE